MREVDGWLQMLTVLKVIGWVWLGVGALVLWHTIAALSRVREVIQPTGSEVVTQQVLSTVLIFVLPAAVVLALGWFLSARHTS